MPPRLLVIADDLTGALDTGVQFSRAGVKTFVVPNADLESSLADCDAPVIVVDTESRHLPPDRAAVRVAFCVRTARSAGIDLFYKKTDSTLRGNVGAELSALLFAAGGKELFFVPAFPNAGRITRSGVQLVNGVPLHASSFADDPRDPVYGRSVKQIIAAQSEVPVVAVARGADPALALAGSGKPTIIIVDAETHKDLEDIADMLAACGIPRLTAGCSGFAAALPRLHGLPSGPVPPVVLRPPLLVVSGSLHDCSLNQLREAESRGMPSLVLDHGTLQHPGALQRMAIEIVERLREHRVMIVRTSGRRVAEPHEAAALPREIGRLVRRVLGTTEVPTIALFGGDTAFAVIEALRIHGLQPIEEVCPGVVVSRAFRTGTGTGDVMHLVTKAGGFGPVDVIERIRDTLAREV